MGSPVALAGGTATSAAVSGLARGSHVVEAAYSGDASRAISTSGPVTFTVARRGTTTTVDVTPDNPERGDLISFSATVDPVPDGGTVQFTYDGSPYGSPVAVGPGGAATTEASTHFLAGDHLVGATYSGDDRFAPSDAYPETLFTVAKGESSTAIVEVRPDIVAAGDDVEVDVTVSPIPVGGSVQLALDGTDVGAPLTLDSSGKATGTLPYVAAGDRVITAEFSGDADLCRRRPPSRSRCTAPTRRSCAGPSWWCSAVPAAPLASATSSACWPTASAPRASPCGWPPPPRAVAGSSI